ncbi:hypothetical protein CYMTET_49323 [Cymbomonas tetramitiformis]|uniref:Uncharacterized protein n=1 Tax=Cymbomonas tetramitiformis TaxID=36881 RepID=A0AAE0BQF9_9CHLO|nr:hypothetical protein CYMTET_49323 [Cymbomonas tetramitiformis]
MCAGAALPDRSDLTEIVLALKKEVVQLKAKIDSHGFTPRSQKPGRGPPLTRPGSAPLPTGGNISQKVFTKKVAFDKRNASFVPFCKHSACEKSNAKHWHRDCPHGGPRAESGQNFCDPISAHALSEPVEHDFLAMTFQAAFDTNDTEKFDALCVRIADGQSEIFEELSAGCFTVTAPDLLSEYTDARPAGIHLGGFTVGGAPPPQPPPPTAAVDDPAVESSDEEDILACRPVPAGPPPPHDESFCKQFGPVEIVTFADRVARDMGHESHFDGPAFQNFNCDDNSGILPDDSDSDVDVSHESTLDGPVVLPPPQSFGGALPIRFQRMALPLLLAAFFCVCATAAPVTACGVGGVSQTNFDLIIPPVGGAGRVPDVRPDPPPLTSPKILGCSSTLTTSLTPTTAAAEMHETSSYRTLLRAGTRVSSPTSSG